MDDARDWNIETYATSLPEARHLEDLHNLTKDMQLVLELLKRLTSKQDNDPVRWKAEYVTALITYRRCFTSGLRTPLSNADVEKLPSSAGVHSRILAQANRFAAHSVNPFDRTSVGIMIRNGNSLAGIGMLTAVLMAPDGAELVQWGKLVEDILAEVLSPRREALNAELLRSASALSIEEIKKGGIMKMTVDPAEDPKSRRA